jgi:hypothetical protein
MATLRKQLQKSKRLRTNKLTAVIFDFIRLNEKSLVAIQKQRISVESKDTDGNPIGFYSSATEALSGGRKKAGKPFTGIDSGDWFKGFYVKRVGDKFIFGSSDRKSDDILNSESWLSDKLFGLSDDELLKVVSEEMLPFFILHIKRVLEL